MMFFVLCEEENAPLTLKELLQKVLWGFTSYNSIICKWNVSAVAPKQLFSLGKQFKVIGNEEVLQNHFAGGETCGLVPGLRSILMFNVTTSLN